MKFTRFFTGFAFLLAMLLLSACARLEVGIETTSTPDHAAVSTAVASTMQAIQPTATPQPTKSVTPPIDPTAEGFTPESSPAPQETPTDAPITGPVSPFAGLIYRLGDQAFRIGPDGQPVALAPGLDPQVLPGQYTPRTAFSPDGKTMISWWDFSDLWLVDLTTGKSTNLTNTPDRVEYSAQFWPSRPDVLIFMSQAVADQGPGGGYLTTIKLDGSDYRILDQASASIGMPALSPDGKTIAYDRGGDAWLYRWDSGPEQLNLADYHVDRPLKLANPAWSPKGKYLAWMGVADPSSPQAQTGIALFDMESSGYRLLHPFQPVGGDGWVNTPAWSPDGAWLAVYDISQAQPGIWVLHPDGSGERLVYAASTSRSVAGIGAWWSTDSQRLLVFDPNAEGGGRATLVEIATGKAADLPLPAGSFPLGWIDTNASGK